MEGDRLGRRYAWQWPLGLGLGGKVSDSVYIGGYLGLAFGAEGSDLDIEAARLAKAAAVAEGASVATPPSMTTTSAPATK